MKKFLLTAAIMLLPFVAQAKTSMGEGHMVYPRTVTQDSACLIAEDVAKANAIQKVTGKILNINETATCSEGELGFSCRHNQFTWTVLEGYMREVKSINEIDVRASERYRRCTVRIIGDVYIPKAKPDPNFEIKAHTNKQTYTNSESMYLNVEYTENANITVFQWNPYAGDGKDSIKRIFPYMGNTLVEYDRITNVEMNIPNISKGYYFKAANDIGLEIEDNYVMVLGTKEKIEFLSSYDRESFAQKLFEIGVDNYRIKKIQYNVTK